MALGDIFKKDRVNADQPQQNTTTTSNTQQAQTPKQNTSAPQAQSQSTAKKSSVNSPFTGLGSAAKSGVNAGLDAMISAGSKAAIGTSLAGDLAGLGISALGAGAGILTGGISAALAAGDYAKSSIELKRLMEEKPEYQRSPELNALYDEIESMKNAPPEFQDEYKERIEAKLAEIENRPDFEYDFTQDPTYQNYREQYIREGNLAMQDTVADVASLTGGYGSSYAASAGSQAFQSYLNDLNNVIPELQQQAYQRYRDEGEDMWNEFSALRGLREDEFAQYQQEYQQYVDKVNMSFQMAQMLSDEEWNQYLADLDTWQFQINMANGNKQNAMGNMMQGGAMVADSLSGFGGQVSAVASDTANLMNNISQFSDSMNYNRERAAAEDAQWQAEMDEKIRQYDQNFAEDKRRFDMEFGYQKERDAVADAQAAAKASASGGSSGGSSGSGSKSRSTSSAAKTGSAGNSSKEPLTYNIVRKALTAEGHDPHIIKPELFNNSVSKDGAVTYKGVKYKNYEDYLEAVLVAYDISLTE